MFESRRRRRVQRGISQGSPRRGRSRGGWRSPAGRLGGFLIGDRGNPLGRDLRWEWLEDRAMLTNAVTAAPAAMTMLPNTPADINLLAYCTAPDNTNSAFTLYLETNQYFNELDWPIGFLPPPQFVYVGNKQEVQINPPTAAVTAGETTSFQYAVVNQTALAANNYKYIEGTDWEDNTVTLTFETSYGSGTLQNPYAGNVIANTTAGTAVSIPVNVNDPNGLSTTISTPTPTVSPAGAGTVEINPNASPAGSAFLFTPAAGFAGQCTFSYQVTDTANKTSNSATVTVNVTAPTATWQGGGPDDNWSDTNNWLNGVAPDEGYAVVFPSGVINTTSNNDISGLTLSSMTIAGNYTLGGNAVLLTGSINVTSGTPTVNIPIDDTGNLTVDVSSGAELVDLDSTGDGNETYTGEVAYLDDDASGTTTLNNATIDMSSLGTAVVGAATVQPAASSTTILGTGPLVLDNSNYFRSIPANQTVTLNNSTISFGGTITVSGTTNSNLTLAGPISVDLPTTVSALGAGLTVDLAGQLSGIGSLNLKSDGKATFEIDQNNAGDGTKANPGFSGSVDVFSSVAISQSDAFGTGELTLDEFSSINVLSTGENLDLANTPLQIDGSFSISSAGDALFFGSSLSQVFVNLSATITLNNAIPVVFSGTMEDGSFDGESSAGDDGLTLVGTTVGSEEGTFEFDGDNGPNDEESGTGGYTGPITLQGGVIVGSDDALGTGQITVASYNNGATNSSITVAAVTASGSNVSNISLPNPLVLTNPLTLANISDDDTDSLTGALAGTAALTLNGGTWSFGAASSTFSGTVNFQSATAQVDGNQDLGTGRWIAVTGSSILQYEGFGVATFANGLTINDGASFTALGTVVLSSPVTTFTSATIGAGSASQLTLQGAVNSTSNSGALTVSGVGTTDFANALNVNVLTINGGTAEFESTVTSKAGIFWSGGNIQVNANNALGSGTLTVIIPLGSGSTLGWGTSVPANSPPLSLQNRVEVDNSCIFSVSSNIVLTGELDLFPCWLNPTSGATLTLNGPLVAMVASVPLTLGYGGSSGTVVLGVGLPADVTAVTVSSGTTLSLAAAAAGSAVLNVKGTLNSTAANSYAGNILLSGTVSAAAGIAGTNPTVLGTGNISVYGALSGSGTVPPTWNVPYSIANNLGFYGGTTAIASSFTASGLITVTGDSEVDPASGVVMTANCTCIGTGNLTVGGAGTLQLAGNSAGTLTIDVNTGATLSSSASNSFAGLIVMQGGTLSAPYGITGSPTLFGTAGISFYNTDNLQVPYTIPNNLFLNQATLKIADAFTETGSVTLDSGSLSEIDPDGVVVTFGTSGLFGSPVTVTASDPPTLGILNVGGTGTLVLASGTLAPSALIAAIPQGTVEVLSGFTSNGGIYAKGGTIELNAAGSTSDGVEFSNPQGGSLGGMTATANPSPNPLPGYVKAPVGFFGFTIVDLAPGASTMLTITLPPGATANAYWKYGIPPGGTTPQWYDFMYNAATNTGAQFSDGGNTITLNFVANSNGTVTDPGGPGVAITPASSVTALAARTSLTNLPVSWSGTDSGGPGIASYTIYVSTNGGAYTAWQTNTTQTSGTYSATVGDTYAFYAQATDTDGVIELPHASADTTVAVATYPWQNPANALDVIGKGGPIVPLDALDVINYLNNTPAGTPLPPTFPTGSEYLDVNGTGLVIPDDALKIIDYLNNHAAPAAEPAVSPAVSPAVAPAVTSSSVGSAVRTDDSPMSYDAANVRGAGGPDLVRTADPAWLPPPAQSSSPVVSPAVIASGQLTGPANNSTPASSSASASVGTVPAGIVPVGPPQSAVKLSTASAGQSAYNRSSAGTVDWLLSDPALDWLDETAEGR
jgi:hypothetical protein